MKRIACIFATLVMALSLNAQSKGYEKSIEVFGGPGLNKLTKYQIGISMVNGYRINDYFYAGVGAGFRFQESRYMYSFGPGDKFDYDSREPRYIIPLYARVKANLTKTSISPFFIADIGGNIDVGMVEYKTIQGFFFEPQFGVDIDLTDPISLYLAIGANIAKAKYYSFDFYDTNSIQDEYRGLASSLVFHVGIKF